MYILLYTAAGSAEMLVARVDKEEGSRAIFSNNAHHHSNVMTRNLAQCIATWRWGNNSYHLVRESRLHKISTRHSLSDITFGLVDIYIPALLCWQNWLLAFTTTLYFLMKALLWHVIQVTQADMTLCGNRFEFGWLAMTSGHCTYKEWGKSRTKRCKKTKGDIILYWSTWDGVAAIHCSRDNREACYYLNGCADPVQLHAHSYHSSGYATVPQKSLLCSKGDLIRAWGSQWIS